MVDWGKNWRPFEIAAVCQGLDVAELDRLVDRLKVERWMMLFVPEHQFEVHWKD